MLAVVGSDVDTARSQEDAARAPWPLRFLSIDGSTVEPTVDGGVLRAPLHWPLEPEEGFSFRFVTTMSGHAGSAPPGTEDIAVALLCR